MSFTSSSLQPNSDNVPAVPLKRILLIDDDQFLCSATAEYIERMASKFTNEPVAVKPVFSLAAGMAAISAPGYPDLVFLDLTSPRRNQRNRNLGTLPASQLP